MDKLEISVKNDLVLKLIVDELANVYACHTIILYGSRARGDYTSISDYDVAGISATGEKKRIARFDQMHGVYLDIFVYPESDFLVLKQDHLTMSDGVVLVESNDYGRNLISKLNIMLNEPELISSDEIEARKVWYKKMLSRASIGDLEGKYRHIWSIFTILEDYFVFRKLRFQGPKKAFQYLVMNDPETLLLFENAISNINDIGALDKLIIRAIG